MIQRVAIYVRTSTDKTQTVRRQFRQLNEVTVRLGRVIAVVYPDEGVSGMIRDRVLAGLDRTNAKVRNLGRPPMETAKVEAIRSTLFAGPDIRASARLTGAGTASVLRIEQTMLEALAS